MEKKIPCQISLVFNSAWFISDDKKQEVCSLSCASRSWKKTSLSSYI
jgi:hypothetical protein